MTAGALRGWSPGRLGGRQVEVAARAPPARVGELGQGASVKRLVRAGSARARAAAVLGPIVHDDDVAGLRLADQEPGDEPRGGALQRGQIHGVVREGPAARAGVEREVGDRTGFPQT
ncbi:unnamed protein product [Prorocentrum cordatum]|uniref:Uncharacterized protein n=1 Tax=Prorocentrum cordatum TaxID=2364126 RepID=A0ABN9TQ71_9DINO|nr:unnamed protein product [Polarella glacialis]